MIVVNGAIKAKEKTGGGLDSEGNPVPTSFVFGNSIPCRYRPNRNSLKGKHDGNAFTIASYEILIDIDAEFTSEQIQLLNVDGDIVGEFSIMWVEELDAVSAKKITV